MNNLTLRIVDPDIFCSADNFREALRAIGRKNPYHIQQCSLLSHRRIDWTKPLTDNEFEKLGELNLYKKLNRSLKYPRKYSITKIRNAKMVKRKQIGADCNTTNRYTVTVPSDEYIRIVSAAYELLYKIDKRVLYRLLLNENQDQYGGKTYYSSNSLHTISPIQTGIILCAVIRRNDYRKNKLDSLREEIRNFRR